MFGRRRKQSAEERMIEIMSSPYPQDYVLSSEAKKAFNGLSADADGYVLLGDITSNMLNEQGQNFSFYISGLKPSTPVISKGLRVDVTSSSYEKFRVHKDDVVELIARVRAYRRVTTGRTTP